MRGLHGNEALLVRVLKDFHAWSVLLSLRDDWRVDSRVAWCSEVRVSGVGPRVLDGCDDGGGWSLFRAKMEGWRKE